VSGPGPVALDRRSVALVAVGGALGAIGRTALAERFPTPAHRFPVTILVVNLAGALLLGLLMGRVAHRDHDTWRRPFLAIGVLGGLTTFSTLCVDAARLTAGGDVGVAGLDLLVSAVGGALAVALGVAIASGGRAHHLADEGEA
jgi:CrcB protein